MLHDDMQASSRLHKELFLLASMYDIVCIIIEIIGLAIIHSIGYIGILSIASKLHRVVSRSDAVG